MNSSIGLDRCRRVVRVRYCTRSVVLESPVRLSSRFDIYHICWYLNMSGTPELGVLPKKPNASRGLVFLLLKLPGTKTIQDSAPDKERTIGLVLDN